MTVAELIEKLQAMPGHIPVHVETTSDGSGGGCDTNYLFVLDCELSAFPSQGRMAVITINETPT